jgi:glycosyltransferase involved in cell wall biosynthesis
MASRTEARNAAPVDVVFLVSTLRRSGPTGQLLNIVAELDRSRFVPHIVTLSPEPRSSMKDAFAALGTELRSLELTRLQGALRRSWRSDIERVTGIRLSSSVVVHTHGIRPDTIAARHLAGTPTVATARNYPYHDYVMKFGPIVGRLMAWTHVRILRRLPVVVACSGTVAELLRRHGVVSEVIRDGIDLAVFRPGGDGSQTRMRARLGIPSDAPLGVCVGTLSERKNPLSVVRAMRSIPDARLTMVFVGSGELEERCRRTAGTDERIRFVGQVDNVVQYLQAADFLVSAARSEGLPNAVLEAIACGVRVVLSDIAPHRETLTLAPAAGELFADGDVRALADALGRAALLPRLTLDDELERARALIGAQRMSRSYQQLYLRLAGTTETVPARCPA